MVVVKRRFRRTDFKDTKRQHDFSKDRCTVCGMQRVVWEATNVPCPGEPYATDSHGPLSRRAD